jgi:hypothetical protein
MSGPGDFKIYDSSEVSIIFAGIPIDGGYGEDEFLRVAPASDDFSDVVGVDGSVTRSKTNDRRAEVTITLMQSASANDALSVLRNLDINTPGGAGVGPLMIRDKSGRALYAATKAWIAGPPEASFKKGPEARVWKLRCAKLDRFDGGN